MRGSLLLAALTSVVSVAGFSFTTSTPSQCGDFTVTWTGGTAPYQLIMIPTITVTSGVIVNMTIPTNATGSYTFTLDEPSGLEFIAAMSDSTGFGTGGTTSVLTVGSSSDTSCLNTNLLYDFFFSVDPTSNPAQCSSQAITWENNVTLPVGAYGFIPSGSAFSIPIQQSTSDITYDWTVDIASGTQYLILMADDGTYKTGGSTSLMTVQSGSTSCMNSSSPHSGAATTSSSSSASASSTPSSSSVAGIGGSSSGGTSGTTANDTSSKSNTGAIVGGTVGGVAFLVLLALLLLCCIRRRARTKDSEADPAIKSYGTAPGEKRRNPMDLLSRGRHNSEGDGLVEGDGLAARNNAGENGRPFEVNGAEYEPSPFRYPSPPHTPGETALPPSSFAVGAVAKANEGSMTARPSGDQRPSVESTRTGGTTNPSQLPPSSELATLGHHNSIRKPTSANLIIPATPPQGGADARRLPETPTTESGARFVQHEDSGEVVDLPPRYDQLRTRNPDAVE
ncbi:hypothetical protein P7C73_g3422, partial [Tremellales sp. Uapishka_1]